MTRVKICGLRDAAKAVEAAKAGADFIGLVFAESKRKVTPQECHDVVAALHELRRVKEPALFEGPQPGDVSARSWFGVWSDAIDDALFRCRPLVVGVFADMPFSDVNEIAEAAKLDLVQLSGGENDSFCRKIERPVLRTIHVHEGMTADDIFEAAVPGASAAIHLDTASPIARGGTGQPFDEDAATEVAARLPIMLAGGLTPDSVAAAIEHVQPWAVDVSSGVETDGRKDIEKIRGFIRAAKGAHNER